MTDRTTEYTACYTRALDASRGKWNENQKRFGSYVEQLDHFVFFSSLDVTSVDAIACVVESDVRHPVHGIIVQLRSQNYCKDHFAKGTTVIYSKVWEMSENVTAVAN